MKERMEGRRRGITEQTSIEDWRGIRKGRR
jgi:hypothetical protein